MKKRMKTAGSGLAIIAMGMALLSGCLGQAEPADTQTPASTATPAQTSSPALTPAPAWTAAPGVTAGSDSAEHTLLSEILTRAQAGKTINCDYALKSDMAAIEDAWGAPDSSEYVADAKGTYALYTSRGVAFGFNKGAQVFEVRSFDDRLGQLRYSAVIAELGNPPHHVTTAAEEIIGYYAGTETKLLLVFPKITDAGPDPALTHYSVFYPAGTVNMMADDPGREW